MKLAIAVAAALFLSAGVAAAQPAPAAPAVPAIPQPPPLVSGCPALPPEMPMPDGATADVATMTAFETYMSTQNAIYACRNAEIAGLRAQIETRVAAYNTAVQTWPAEVAEYNVAHPPRRRR
jgi:hypothetical protein